MSHWRLSVFRLSVTVCALRPRSCTTGFWTRYLANHLWEFLLNLWLRCSLELVRHWSQRSRSRPTVGSEVNVKANCGVRGQGQGQLWGQRSRSTVWSEVKVEAYCGVRGQCQCLLWGQRSRSRPTVGSEVKVNCVVRGQGRGLLWGQRSMSRPTVGSEVKVEANCGVRGQGQLCGQRSRSRPTVGSEVKSRPTVVKKHLFKNATFQQRQCVPVDAHCWKPSLVVNYFLFYCDIVWIEFCPFHECWSFCC